MKVLTYNDLKITVIRQTERPAEVIGLGLQNCMRQLEIETVHGRMTQQQADFIRTADHMSPLEHASMTIFIENVSRSFLAQVTRHRTFKFTSSSQHYQDYSDYPVIVDNAFTARFGPAMQHNVRAYTTAVEQMVPKEEARQLLPGASAVNLLITADARNMVNFFRQRRCLRNVKEMVNFADEWWKLAVNWLPEIFQKVGAHCYEFGTCNQGKMKAEECKLMDLKAKGTRYEEAESLTTRAYGSLGGGDD